MVAWTSLLLLLEKGCPADPSRVAPDASFASSSGLRAAAVGDLHPASSAPSHARVPRVGALESPQSGLRSRGTGGSRARDAAANEALKLSLRNAVCGPARGHLRSAPAHRPSYITPAPPRKT